MSYNELGNMPAETVDELWRSYLERTTLEKLDASRRQLITAMYSNGMLGGDDLKKQIESINSSHDQARRAVILGETVADDSEFRTDTKSDFFTKVKPKNSAN